MIKYLIEEQKSYIKYVTSSKNALYNKIDLLTRIGSWKTGIIDHGRIL